MVLTGICGTVLSKKDIIDKRNVSDDVDGKNNCENGSGNNGNGDGDNNMDGKTAKKGEKTCK